MNGTGRRKDDVVANRSAEGLKAGQQVYAVIEFCSSAETLWGKIASRKWEWLGVHASRGGKVRYVLGRPPRAGVMSVTIQAEARHGLAATDANRVELTVPTHRPLVSVYPTGTEAEAAYEARLANLRAEDGSSALARVRLFLEGKPVREDFVVRTVVNER